VTRVYLVRHGRAAAGWDLDSDPDLDEFGWRQAYAAAEVLAPFGPCEILSSPLLRCRSTAIPTAASWGVEPVIEPAVTEIPSPDGVAMSDRASWLRVVTKGTWTALGPRYTTYRDQVVARVAACTNDTVIFSHFVAINAVIGACLEDDRVVIRSLDNCSVTVVEISAEGIVLVETGHEADTLIR
jgi:broad specificity phosphatase PhoE